MTAATTGLITINLAELWREHWLRSWSDIGRVHFMRESEQHIEFHEPLKWLGACQCFPCRVMEAWSHRHEAR